MYIYSRKKIDKNFTHFGDALCNIYIYILLHLLHVVFNLTIE